MHAGKDGRRCAQNRVHGGRVACAGSSNAALAPTAIIAALTGASGGGAHGGVSGGELWPPGGDGDSNGGGDIGDGDGKAGGVEDGGKISGWAGDGGAVDVALPCLPI